MGQQYTKMESETNAVNAFRCIFCDGDLVWHSTVQASDFIADYEDDDIAAVNYYVCSKCGRSYEIVDPCESERDSDYSEYWKEYTGD